MAEDASQLASQTPGSGGKILVVEDDIDIANLLTMLLKSAGYEVRSANDGQNGLLAADEFEPDLLLLDIVMPGMNGFEVTQILRNTPRYAERFSRTPIIYFTGHRQIKQNRLRTVPDPPVSDWIFKPFKPPDLLDKVKQVMARA